MNHESNPRFECIEAAQEYLRLLCAAVLEARQDVEADVRAQAGSEPQRRLEALRLVLYKLEDLEKHVKTSHRILNDLRTLRRLLLEGGVGKAETPATAVSEAEVHELFQQVLAAAYTLQEHNDHLLLKEPKADFPQTLSDRVIAENADLIPLVSLTPKPWAEIELPLESVLPMAQADVEPLASLNDSVLQPETDARVPVLAREVLEAATCKRSRSKPEPLIKLVQHAVPRAAPANLSKQRTVLEGHDGGSNDNGSGFGSAAGRVDRSPVTVACRAGAALGSGAAASTLPESKTQRDDSGAARWRPHEDDGDGTAGNEDRTDRDNCC